MTLPEIPETAMTEAANVMWDRWGGGDISHEGYAMAAPVVLAAAWPHLYAAALNDVADRIDATHSLDGGRGWDTNTDTIRAYADEVER